MALNSSHSRLSYKINNMSPNHNLRGLNPLLRRDLDLSITLAPHEISEFDTTQTRTFNDTTLRQALNETTIIASGARISKVTDELCEMFYEVLQTSSYADVTDTIGRFIQACNDSLEKIDPGDRFSAKNMWLAEEANTWRLLYCLHLDRAQSGAPAAEELEREALSQKKLVARLFRADAELRAMQLVVDWLENCAGYQDLCRPPLGWAGATQHWENTLHHLHSGNSLFSAGIANFVSALDPDAPRRQKRPLHALDQQDDNNLCQRMFKELRCGRFDEAVSLCVNAGQMWRGLILQGQRLLDYPELPRDDTTFPLEGNPSRDLWKLCCMGLLTETDENAHFKATLGVLCGHLPSVLPLCGDIWEDLLWAHLRIQIELQVDRHLREHYSTVSAVTTDEGLQELQERYDRPVELSLHQIFGTVNALHKNTPETYYQETQRHLILRQLGSLLRRASSWMSSDDYNLIRFLAHLVIVIRRIGDDPVHDIGDEILKTYVEKLIEQIDGTTITPELIAHYTSTLPVEYQIQKYSQLMWLIEAKDDRQRVMEAGTRAGLDVQAAARETVAFAIKVLKEPQISSPGNNTTILKDENELFQRIVQRVIGCLEWFSFYPSQIPEAVQMSNAIIRTLIFKGDVDSATGVLNCLQKFCPTGKIVQSMSPTSKAVGEHLCLKAYIEAINGYTMWYRQHVGGRPRSPESLPPNSSFTDKVHYEQIKAQALLQRERWVEAGAHQARHNKQLLYNVILFPRGWLVDDVVPDETRVASDFEDAADREQQLTSLRKLCIPEIVLLLLKVLQSGSVESQSEAIRLAEILASERHQLYKLFSKHKLREVLHKIGESSLAVLENECDPWGFKTSV